MERVDGHLPGSGFVFIIGAPRSGTTWLHRMVASHPQFATAPQELTLFSRYITPVVQGFDKERMHMERGDWQQGLPLLYSAAEFEVAIRNAIDAVYDRVLALNTSATHILEKHPAYTYHLPLIERFLPGCRFVHLVRDGRDVAVSMMSARERIGFGTSTLTDSAADWYASVLLAQRHGELVGLERYMEVRYEDLLVGTKDHLQRIFDFCGTPMDPAECERIASEYHHSRKQVSSGDPSLNALRGKEGGIWGSKFSLRERYLFHRVAGDMLVKLGYDTEGWWAKGPLDRIGIAAFWLRMKLSETMRTLLAIWTRPLGRPPQLGDATATPLQGR